MRLFKSALVIFSLAVGGSATAEVFNCSVQSHGPYKIIAEKIVFDVDTRTKKVMVADAVLAYFSQMPTSGRLQRYNDKVVVVSWKLRAAAGNENQKTVPETFTYKAVLDRKTKKVAISAYVDPTYQVKGTGICASGKSKAEKKQKRPEVVGNSEYSCAAGEGRHTGTCADEHLEKQKTLGSNCGDPGYEQNFDC